MKLKNIRCFLSELDPGKSLQSFAEQTCPESIIVRLAETMAPDKGVSSEDCLPRVRGTDGKPFQCDGQVSHRTDTNVCLSPLAISRAPATPRSYCEMTTAFPAKAREYSLKIIDEGGFL